MFPISLRGVTLRMRALVASGVALVALVAVGLLLSVQYALTAAVGSAVNDALSPASDASAALTLEQANAAGSLSDYLMLGRAASLDEYRQSVGRADILLGEIAKTLPADDQELADLLATAQAAQRTWVKTDAAPSIALMEAGKEGKAMKETNSTAAWDAYDEMTTASTGPARRRQRRA